MELKETIELMNSDNYVDRFIAEYRQLEVRRNGLYRMLNKYLRDEKVLEAIDHYQKVETQLVDQNIKAMREKALKTINELMDSDDDKVRYQASKDVLDRTGHLATMKKEVTITHKSFEEQLNEIINADYTVEGE